MFSPATLAVLHRLVAILLALVDALASPIEGAPRPALARLATRAFSTYLERLAAHFTDMAGQAAADPPPPPHRTRPHRTRHPHTPPATRIIQFSSPPTPDATPASFEASAQPLGLSTSSSL